MPFAGEYREAMGLPGVGDLVGGFLLEALEVSHVGVAPGRYEYPIEMVLRGKGGKEGVRSVLRPLGSTRRTIFSQYGNPYQCSMGRMEVESLGDGRYRVSSRGAGTRVHLKEELARFLAYLATSGQCPQAAGAPGQGDVVDGYLRRYQEEARRPRGRFGQETAISSRG